MEFFYIYEHIYIHLYVHTHDRLCGLVVAGYRSGGPGFDSRTLQENKVVGLERGCNVVVVGKGRLSDDWCVVLFFTLLSLG
jgi:hypothetical protein